MEKKSIISLGMNCEVSFQIERYVDKLDASLFTWAFIENDDLFLQALENLDAIFEEKIKFAESTEDMFWCERFRIAFHGRKNKKEMLDDVGNIINQEAYESNICELKSRIRYLKKKFTEQLKSENEIYFIKKMQIDNDIEHAREIISSLYNYLETHCVYRNFKLYIVVEEKYLSSLQFLENDNLLVRALSFFAPADNTQNGADNKGWEAIFHEILFGVKIEKENVSRGMIEIYKELQMSQKKCRQQGIEIEKLRQLICEKDKWISELQSGKDWLEHQYFELINHNRYF